MKQNLTITISSNYDACKDKLAIELVDNLHKELSVFNRSLFSYSKHKFRTGYSIVHLTQFASTVTILLKFFLCLLEFQTTRAIKTFKIIKSNNICNQ